MYVIHRDKRDEQDKRMYRVEGEEGYTTDITRAWTFILAQTADSVVDTETETVVDHDYFMRRPWRAEDMEAWVSENRKDTDD